MRIHGYIQVGPAPQPEDIVWENLSFSTGKRVLIQVSEMQCTTGHLHALGLAFACIPAAREYKQMLQAVQKNSVIVEPQVVLWTTALSLCLASFCIAGMLIILNINLKNKDFTGVRRIDRLQIKATCLCRKGAIFAESASVL